MYKALSPAVVREMGERGEIIVTVKSGWEQSGGWVAKPGFISYCLATTQERIFSCYITYEGDTIQITNLEPTELIAGQKQLVDAYMHVAICGIIKHGLMLRFKRLIVDSHIPAITDHLLDLGFFITAKGAFSGSGARGFKLLEE